jgi:hypothetical protein
VNHHNLQGDEHAKRFPVANHVDLFLLAKTILSMVNGTLEFGPSAILTAWCQRLAERYAGSGAVMLPILAKVAKLKLRTEEDDLGSPDVGLQEEE